MKTEQEFKNKCTPEIIKWMVELAEGFEWREDIEFENNFYFSHKDYEWIWIGNIDTVQFPLLIHRAVEGWNKKESISFSIGTIIYPLLLERILDSEEYHIEYKFDNYQPQSLTQAECAMLDCLIDIFEEEKK